MNDTQLTKFLAAQQQAVKDSGMPEEIALMAEVLAGDAKHAFNLAKALVETATENGAGAFAITAHLMVALADRSPEATTILLTHTAAFLAERVAELEAAAVKQVDVTVVH